jgi:hypothetical protein
MLQPQHGRADSDRMPNAHTQHSYGVALRHRPAAAAAAAAAGEASSSITSSSSSSTTR